MRTIYTLYYYYVRTLEPIWFPHWPIDVEEKEVEKRVDFVKVLEVNISI